MGNDNRVFLERISLNDRASMYCSYRRMVTLECWSLLTRESIMERGVTLLILTDTNVAG